MQDESRDNVKELISKLKVVFCTGQVGSATSGPELTNDVPPYPGQLQFYPDKPVFNVSGYTSTLAATLQSLKVIAVSVSVTRG